MSITTALSKYLNACSSTKKKKKKNKHHLYCSTVHKEIKYTVCKYIIESDFNHLSMKEYPQMNKEPSRLHTESMKTAWLYGQGSVSKAGKKIIKMLIVTHRSYLAHSPKCICHYTCHHQEAGELDKQLLEKLKFLHSF